jgi:phage baseplate assembly protein gpV
MAISASAAMALPNWTVEKARGGTVVTPAAGEVNAVEIASTTEAPTLEVPGVGINLKCTTIL